MFSVNGVIRASRMTGCYWVMDCKLCGSTLGTLILATEETRQIWMNIVALVPEWAPLC